MIDKHKTNFDCLRKLSHFLSVLWEFEQLKIYLYKVFADLTVHHIISNDSKQLSLIDGMFSSLGVLVKGILALKHCTISA